MKNLKSKLILITCMICVICLGITASVSYFNASGKLKEKEGESAQLLAEKSAGQIDAWMKEQAAFLDAIAASIEADGSTDHEELCAYFTYILENCNEDDVLYDIYYTSLENRMAAGSGYVPEPDIDFTQRSWFAEALNSEGLHYEAPYKDVDSGRIVITISRKITINGEVKGILAEDIFVDTVVETVNQCQVPNNSYAMLLDQNQGVAVHPNSDYGYVDDEPVPMQDLSGNPYEKLVPMLQGDVREEVFVKDYDGVTRAMYAAPVEECSWMLLVAVDKAVLNEAANTMFTGFAVATVVSLLIGIVIISLAAGQIVKPIRRLADTVESRDFTHEIHISSKDEIGRLARGFNEMFQSLKRLLETFGGAADSIKGAAAVLDDITREVVDGADEVKGKMDGISGSVGMQNQSVAEGRDKLERFQDQIDSFRYQFADMNEIVSGVSSNLTENAAIMKELETSTAVSLENMEKLQSGVQLLKEKSGRITDIIATITEISSQTNLLALNASIEAARAGEAGKGFAVVADEIRNLSEQTDQASGDIRVLIMEIQSQISETVKDIENVADLSEKSTVVSQQVGSLFDGINTSVESMDGNNQGLQSGLCAFVEAKDNITTAFQAIEESTDSCLAYSAQALDITVKQAEAVSQLKEFAQKLGAMSGELNDKLEGFQA